MIDLQNVHSLLFGNKMKFKPTIIILFICFIYLNSHIITSLTFVSHFLTIPIPKTHIRYISTWVHNDNTTNIPTNPLYLIPLTNINHIFVPKIRVKLFQMYLINIHIMVLAHLHLLNYRYGVTYYFVRLWNR